ncbi:hypothetical protein [Bremerella cremea]|uniref:hypothetical protein n=1 Tax=Bremerella cremea TaxID=1031537 RepID=UPI0031E900AD
MMSKIYLPSIVLLSVLLTGCMSGWNRGAKESSSLNSYLDHQAATKARPMSTKPAGMEEKPPEKNILVESESSDVSLGKKLAARLAEADQQQPPSTEAKKPASYAARVAALTLPEADKQQILTEFASANDSQWEELLSKLEPVFGPKTETKIAQQTPPPAQSEDMVQKYATKLVQQHLASGSVPQPATNAEEGPKRLPSTNMHQDTSHLAQVDPDLYPKTIDLERGKTMPGARQPVAPEARNHRDAGVQLAAHVSEVDAGSEGLYPEDVQVVAYNQMRNETKSLPDKMAGPKKKPAEEESVSKLTKDEYRVMQILWERGQVSLEALHKDYLAQFGPEQSRTSPNPIAMSLDELHAILFDLKGRGWIADTRRGNTVAYWASRNQPESSSGDWEKLVSDSIQQLQQVAGDSRLSEEERTIAQLRLRMLYLVADRKSDALEKVEGLSPEEQEVWSNTLFGLADYMQVEEIPVERRHSLALGSFRRVMSHLEAASPLELKNLEFIQSVDSFGQFKPFPSHDFQPQQEVLLYVEVDNFSSRDNGGKFETTLQSNYEIYDQAGRRIDARQFPEVKDSCRVRRRDFYVPYRLYMPENITPGSYRLELTVRDPASDKFGQSSIDFRIK